MIDYIGLICTVVLLILLAYQKRELESTIHNNKKYYEDLIGKIYFDRSILEKGFHNYYVACHGHLKGIARLKKKEENLLLEIEDWKKQLHQATGLQDLDNYRDLITKLTYLEDSNKQLEKDLEESCQETALLLDKYNELEAQLK